ncbi:arylacetamide deacetylase-like 4 [Hemicordylus capensis]|uniref:arylacetamide deacetylase-like 4 n=1 Tax=Hemicordylus capensis TaxID=884348 RepID=UPI0023036F4D|nr:arylacetamide deacetylase-like 4 [Hemicordylus capensis]
MERKDYIAWKLGFSNRHTVTRFFMNGLPIFKQDPRLHIKKLQFDGVPVKQYQPREDHTKHQRGILFFHGGIGIWGSLYIYERVCRYLARESASFVVSVEYRLAPEHPYPAQFEDCLKATIHLLKNAKEYGVDPDCIVISGDSSGATLAAAVCQELVKRTDLPKVRAQILLHPFLQAVDFNLPSYQQNAFAPMISKNTILKVGLKYLGKDWSLLQVAMKGSHVPEDMRIKWKTWINPDHIPKRFKSRGYKPAPPTPFSPKVLEQSNEFFDTTFSPLLAEDDIISQLPETYILTCEYDVLRDDGLLYKKRLEDAGIGVAWEHLEDAFHGIVFVLEIPVFPFSCVTRKLDFVVKFIKGLPVSGEISLAGGVKAFTKGGGGL